MMQLSENQYEVIRPLMPVQRGNVRLSNLDVINAALYVAENGCKLAGTARVAWRMEYQGSFGCRG